MKKNMGRTPLVTVIAIGVALIVPQTASAMPYGHAIKTNTAPAGRCVHNGASTNADGHANCGLHKGANHSNHANRTGDSTGGTPAPPSGGTSDRGGGSGWGGGAG